MSSQSRNTGPGLFAGDQSPEALRRRFIEAPLEAAQQSVLSSSLEVAELLSILPDAFLASQQRELERLKKSGKEVNPRIEILQKSIEQAGVFKTTAQRAQARARRALSALADKDSIFHGFVSDEELSPLKGLTVRLIGGKRARVAELSTTTEEDGYFRIVLGPKSKSEREENSADLSQRIRNMISGLSWETIDSAAAASEVDYGQVEILRKGSVLHRDPVALSLETGSAYREYIITNTEPPSASGVENAMSNLSGKGPSSQSGSNREAAEPSQPRTDKPPSPPESSGPSSVPERPPRTENATKRRRNQRK
jgi:hypothetical protein